MADDLLCNGSGGDNYYVSQSQNALSLKSTFPFSQHELGISYPEKIIPMEVNLGGLNLSKPGGGAEGPENSHNLL